MWSTRSTQNVQTLRLERFGLPASRRSDMLLWFLLIAISERDVVRIDVAHARAGADTRVFGQGGQLVGWTAGGAGAAPRVQELDLGGDDLRPLTLLAVLALPRPRPEAALYVDDGPLPRVLGDDHC